MRKLTLYISISLDGYIAEINGGLEWLENFPNPKETDYGYQEFYEKVDTLIMGGKTYRHILDMCDKWPYPEKNTYIISHQPIKATKEEYIIWEKTGWKKLNLSKTKRDKIFG